MATWLLQVISWPKSTGKEHFNSNPSYVWFWFIEILEYLMMNPTSHFGISIHFGFKRNTSWISCLVLLVTNVPGCAAVQLLGHDPEGLGWGKILKYGSSRTMRMKNHEKPRKSECLLGISWGIYHDTLKFPRLRAAVGLMINDDALQQESELFKTSHLFNAMGQNIWVNCSDLIWVNIIYR